jgi:hypothetical protein
MQFGATIVTDGVDPAGPLTSSWAEMKSETRTMMPRGVKTGRKLATTSAARET